MTRSPPGDHLPMGQLDSIQLVCLLTPAACADRLQGPPLKSLWLLELVSSFSSATNQVSPMKPAWVKPGPGPRSLASPVSPRLLAELNAPPGFPSHQSCEAALCPWETLRCLSTSCVWLRRLPCASPG
jgi:hypothetical protein